MRFRCFLPSLDAVLGPVTLSMSVRLRPCLHSPGTNCRFLFSARSSCWFWSPGYRILIMLCSTMQATYINVYQLTSNVPLTYVSVCQRMSNVPRTYGELMQNVLSTRSVRREILNMLNNFSRARRVPNFHSVSQRALNVNDVSPTYP